MGLPLFRSQELVQVSCGECGIQFAMPEAFQRQRREKGGDFYCPNGHCRVYRETDTQRLTKERDDAVKAKERATKEKEWARQEMKTARHAEAVVRGKFKAQSERVHAGVCPCCRRNFKQLRRHMRAKHPEWNGDE